VREVVEHGFPHGAHRQLALSGFDEPTARRPDRVVGVEVVLDDRQRLNQAGAGPLVERPDVIPTRHVEPRQRQLGPPRRGQHQCARLRQGPVGAQDSQSCQQRRYVCRD